MVAFFSSVLGALLVAGVIAAFKSRWLYVVAPKFFLHSHLGSGQVISLSLYNAGLLGEEDVTLVFIPGVKVSMVATSKSTLVMTGNTVAVSRLSKFESVEIVFLFENKPFEPSDIESIESKAGSGKVVQGKDKATSFWHTVVAIPIVVFIFLVPFIFGNFIGAEMQQSLYGYLSDNADVFKESKQLAGYKVATNERYGSGALEGAVKSRKITAEVVEIVQKGDFLLISTMVKNNSPYYISASGYIQASTGGKGGFSWADGRVSDFGLAQGESRLVKQKAYMPEVTSKKMVQNYLRFESIEGGSVDGYQVITIN